MPFIVTTKRRRLDLDESADSERLDRVIASTTESVVSRRAVATPEEAQGLADDRVAEHYYKAQLPGAELPRDYFEYSTAARELPETGGTVGPLPDGTVIEVEYVDLAELAERADDRKPRAQEGYGARIVAAYNAKQATT